MTPDMNAVVERLERLERENRRLKVVGIILAAAVGLAALTGVTTKEPVIGPRPSPWSARKASCEGSSPWSTRNLPSLSSTARERCGRGSASRRMHPVSSSTGRTATRSGALPSLRFRRGA
jgi:hypothetical protein